MKFDTKKCSAVNLRRSSALSGFGLHDSDLVWRNPNQFLSDNDETDDENEENGSQVQHLPRLIYTPVKISTRTNQRNSSLGRNMSSQRTTRTVTDQEMDELNACLLNLQFGDNENQETNIPQENTGTNGESNLRLGRVSQQHIHPKTGKRSSVLRSSRVRKKPVRLGS